MISETLSDLIIEIFRINGRLLAAGDRLVADLGLTSARWQVIGAIAIAGQPQTVPAIARTMGLTRQAVQLHVCLHIGRRAIACSAVAIGRNSAWGRLVKRRN
jgi:hypothetical protein